MQQRSIDEVHNTFRPARRRRAAGIEHTGQQQTVAIKRGLFLVRYAAAEDVEQPPVVKVSQDTASNKDIRFLLHPDHSEAVLWQPDTCLVVQAMAPGTLSVQVLPAQEGGSTAATVRIEPLSQGNATIPLAHTKIRRSKAHDLGNFRVLGHVSGIGDVLVNGYEWLAGPSAPSRIEGISIEWPGKPSELDIHYAVKTAKPQTTSGRKVGLGSFAGTRGKAMPVVELMLEMSGPDASSLQFSVEAIFLGSPTTHIIGRQVITSGPTGREPLVGLRISLESARVAARPAPKATVAKPERSTGRVRVFRSRSSYSQPAPS